MSASSTLLMEALLSNRPFTGGRSGGGFGGTALGSGRRPIGGFIRGRSSFLRDQEDENKQQSLAEIVAQTRREKRKTKIPKRSDRAVQAAGVSAVITEQKRKGRKSTILTSPRGVTEQLGSVSRPQIDAILLGQ